MCCNIGYWLAVKGSNLPGVVCLGGCYVDEMLPVVVDVIALMVICGDVGDCFTVGVFLVWFLVWCVLSRTGDFLVYRSFVGFV